MPEPNCRGTCPECRFDKISSSPGCRPFLVSVRDILSSYLNHGRNKERQLRISWSQEPSIYSSTHDNLFVLSPSLAFPILCVRFSVVLLSFNFSVSALVNPLLFYQATIASPFLMSGFLSSTQLVKVNQWLRDIHTSPVLLDPLHSVVQEIVAEESPNIGMLEVPTYDYERVSEKRSYGTWKSEYLARSSREQLRPEERVIEACCEQLGLAGAFRQDLNTVTSMSSLPHPEGNELVSLACF